MVLEVWGRGTLTFFVPCHRESRGGLLLSAETENGVGDGSAWAAVGWASPLLAPHVAAAQTHRSRSWLRSATLAGVSRSYAASPLLATRQARRLPSASGFCLLFFLNILFPFLCREQCNFNQQAFLEQHFLDRTIPCRHIRAGSPSCV